ncbi:MAG: DNA methyltransferase [Candidatus Hodarchaeales archaeon]
MKTRLSITDLSTITQIVNSPKRDSGYTRTFYSYPAKFLSPLPYFIINNYTNQGELVFDPFVGGGTTGLESMLLERMFIGYDINPFAIFISRVKTTFIEPSLLRNTLEDILLRINSVNEFIQILNSEERLCLGSQISDEIEKLNTLSSVLETPSQEFFKLALIHSIKIIGRRDFEQRKNNKSLLPTFKRKCQKMIKSIATIPKKPRFYPEFILGSNFKTKLRDNSVDLVVTSPPYKDKDIEYQELQIQRRSLNRSLRTHIISRILNTEPLTKTDLNWSGNKGKNYWENNEKSLKECHRVLKDKKLAFFWTGFKQEEDKTQYLEQLIGCGFTIVATIPVKLSNNRTASSRSTHHNRKTGMMNQDFLFITKKKDHP